MNLRIDESPTCLWLPGFPAPSTGLELWGHQAQGQGYWNPHFPITTDAFTAPHPPDLSPGPWGQDQAENHVQNSRPGFSKKTRRMEEPLLLPPVQLQGRITFLHVHPHVYCPQSWSQQSPSPRQGTLCPTHQTGIVQGRIHFLISPS